MSKIKRWLEENIDKLSDRELMALGYSDEDIDWLRGIYSDEEEEND